MGQRETIEKMQEREIRLGIKLKANDNVVDAWARENPLAPCVLSRGVEAKALHALAIPYLL
jgi:hypothetical protein